MFLNEIFKLYIGTRRRDDVDIGGTTGQNKIVENEVSQIRPFWLEMAQAYLVGKPIEAIPNNIPNADKPKLWGKIATYKALEWCVDFHVGQLKSRFAKYRCVEVSKRTQNFS